MAEKQLLIEASEFGLICNFDNQNDKNKLTESLKISKKPNDCLLVRGVPSTRLDVVNQNGRIYPTALMQKAIDEARPKMKAKMLVCSGSEHPTDSTVPPEYISHIITDAYIKNVLIETNGKKERQNVLFCDFLVLPTIPYGINLQKFLLEGIGTGISIRGLGSCDPDGKVTEYELMGADIVGNPSSSVYLSTIIGESVNKAEIKEATEDLTETFIVSASATNVVRDLDSALALSQQIDSANFGTVKKTSTKLDSEVDPKTGAETTMVTLETETEDEVSELDQALALAKQAIMNGKADIDSVTIENVKEEQPQESVENSETPLNEDDTNLGLKKIVDIKGVETTGPDEKELWRVSAELRDADDHNAVEWQRSYKSLADAGVDQTYLDYANGKDMTAENNDGLQEDEGHYAPQPHITPILNYILRNFPKDGEAYEAAAKMANDIVTGRISSTEDREKALEELKKYVMIQHEDYIPESEMNEAGITDEYKADHIGSLDKVAENMVQRQYNFIVGNTQEADPMRQQAENVFAKFEQGKVNAIDTKVVLGEIVQELQKKLWGESCAIKESNDMRTQRCAKVYDYLDAMINNNELSGQEREDAQEMMDAYVAAVLDPRKTDESLDAMLDKLEAYIDSNNISEAKDTEYDVHEFKPQGVDWIHDAVVSLIWNEGLSLEQACRKFCEQNENIPYEYLLEYMRTAPMEESVMTEEPLKAIISYAMGTDGWYVAKLGGSLANLEYIDKQLNNLIKTEHLLVKDKDKPYIDFDYMKEDEIVRLFKALQDKLHVRLDVYNPTADIQGESTMTEAKEEEQEDPNNGKQYVLKCKTNDKYVAMNGNAIDFVDSPKDAIHFIKGNEESGVIHLSGINKILNTMGILDSDIERYFKKDSIDISAHDDVNVQAAESDGIKVEECGNKAPITEDNGSNTRFQATVKINGANGESSENIPVSAVDMEGINAEVGNLYDMKKQNADGEIMIAVVDTSSGQQFMFNPETHQIEAMNTQMEAAGDLEQDGNKLSMEVDDNNKVEKEFDTPAQASVAKAGIEQGKLGGDVLLSEDDTSLDDDDEESEIAKCAWCGGEFEKSALKKEKDLGYLCNTCARGIASREGPLTFEEAENQRYEDIEPGWYAGAQGVGVTGPYESKEALLADLGEVADKIDIEYISAEDLGLAAESTKIDEVMYKEPGEASDPFIVKPLKDATAKDIVVEVANIDWDNDDLYNTFLANYEPGDPVTFGDIESKVKDLPSETAVRLNTDELPDDIDAHAFKAYILDKLSQTYAMKVNNADVLGMHYVN